MELGIISSYNAELQTGDITSVKGEKFTFQFAQGQSMQFGEGLATPQFSGTHDQPEGYALKTPGVGDPVAFQRNNEHGIDVWGYARHYVELVEKRYPSRFST